MDFSKFISYPHWKLIGPGPHHGIALPLSAIRNPQSHGIGEFLDLIPLIQWCSKIGFDVIQLLPINDSGHDTSPYSAHSAMALHPIYLSLGALKYASDYRDELEAMKVCNNSKRVRYHKVLEAKEAFLKKYVTRALPLIRKEASYQEFCQQEWLEGYARYKVLKEKNSQMAWWEWKKTASNLDVDEVEHHKVVQYLCFEQLEKVKQEGVKASVFIKGDIPILINRDSADVWQHPELFNLDFAAGAPPDMYSEEGQYWGFPLYNWPAMEERHYLWWQRRLQLAQRLYHIYRLDHIVGFFKIWAIPEGKKAKEGNFLPQDPNEWIGQGEKILRMMLEASTMLPIGEDLGAVPPNVRECMARLGICGTKVMRWERRWEQDKGFILPQDYPVLSMSTLSTHDSETLEMWWNANPEEAQNFASTLNIPYSKPLSIESRKSGLMACHKSASIFHINLLQEYLDVIDELAWENPEDDRINIPGLVLDRNWTYRFLPTLQQIVSHDKLAAFMTSLSAK